MITWIRFDWKAQPTAEDVAKALAPHGLIVKDFCNGDEYEFAICTPETTNEKIVESIIDNFDSDETQEELKESLMSLIKEVIITPNVTP